MRVLVDILHPAHVHFFRNYIAEAHSNAVEVLVTSRDKDVTIPLLDEFGIAHTQISTQQTGRLGLLKEWLTRSRRLLQTARYFRPDVLAGIMGVSIAPVGRLVGVPSVVFYDTENAVLTNRFVFRLATKVVTPDCYEGPRGTNHLTYPGYHELAYLHPSRFTPERKNLNSFGLDPDRGFSLVRFVSWSSSHDIGDKSLTRDQKLNLVDQLAALGPVAISAEGDVPPELRHMLIRGPIKDIHHVVAAANIVVGDSATMASEAAVLGVPAIYIGETSRGYINDLSARYGLIRWLRLEGWSESVFQSALEMATESNRFVEARKAMLSDKVDVTPIIAQTLTDVTESEQRRVGRRRTTEEA